MNIKIPTWVKPGAWGFVAGAIGYATLAFSAGWMVTKESSIEMADRQSNAAVLAALTPICVAQFKTAGQAQIHLAVMGKEDSAERGAYVAHQGWATMPGSSAPISAVANACAEQLVKLTSQ